MEDNRLVEVLSVFDQTNKDVNNRQVLKIDEDAYRGDVEMEHILHRLLAAASDSKLRQDMNVEDEYFSAIETRDTAIMKRDQRIAEQDAQLEEQSAQLEEQSAQLEEQRAALLASAKALKAAGIPVEQIAEMTKLTIEKIASLL